MTRQAHPLALSVLVFLAGIGSMATEICASRLLAPYYGSSTVVWANIIGLILASLSVGYWLGGRLADRRPSPQLLATIVLAAAVWSPLIPFVARPFLDLSVKGIDTLSTGAVVGSFAASLALFAPPVVLLGMVTPFAIRLAATGVEDAGRVAGRIFALSTAGSLIGTFVPALVTIPLIGTQRTLIGAALIIAASALPLLAGRRLVAGIVVAAVLAALLAVPPGVVKAQPGLLHEEESLYQFIQVVQSGQARYLYLNEGYAIHSVWRADTVLTGGEWDMFLTAPPLLGRPAARVATLGNAAGTTARAFGVYYPQARIDGVEIDPAVTAAGRRWFGLDDNPRLTVHTADARPFLAADGRALRPHPHRRLPAALRALLPGDARVLPALPADGSRPAGSSPSTCPRCPATTDWPTSIAGTLAVGVPPGRDLAGAALQPVRGGPHQAAPAGGHDRPPGGGPARPPLHHQPLRRRPARGGPGGYPVDGRPLPRWNGSPTA